MDADAANNDDGPPAISFPAGNDDFRAARNACTLACRAFNDTPEDASPEVRCQRWLDIVQPGHTPSTDTTIAAVTGELTYRDPTLKPAAPFVKPPLHMDYGLRVRVGSTTFINRYCMILDTPVADVVIGERCNIGPHCAILSVGHPLGRERITKRNSNGREVRIGNGVWIGARVTIMGGVTIGDGAVIGACSLVTHSIPPGVLAFGVPAEVVRILDDSDDDDSCGDVASAETLEEALRVKTEHPALDKDENDAAMIYHRPFRGRQQPLGGGQNHDRRLTRAEIFALVALGVSFFTSFFFAALVVVCKDAVVRIATGGGQDL